MAVEPSAICNRCGKTWMQHSTQIGSHQHFCRLPNGDVGDVWVSDDEFSLPDAGRATKEPEGGHPAFLKLLDEMRALHQKKAADYGRGVDPFANVRASAEFGIPAWVGVMIRAGDKLHRIKSFVANGSLTNESVRDSLMDLAAYSLIALVLLEEEEAKKK